MDGTLTDVSFVDSVWLEGIPRLFAAKKGLSFEDAKNSITKEYDRVGRRRLEWYDLDYWISTLDLDVSPKEVLNNYKHRIRIYEEVPRVLKEIRRRGFRLIVITNARREFVDLELQETGIADYFERVISSTSDFGLIKKTIGLYRRVCEMFNVSPSEMVHVGDDLCFDFEVPRRLGIQAFYLDRTGQNVGKFVVQNLDEFGERLVSPGPE
jgi:putative hydrolase of the HAD superfamily